MNNLHLSLLCFVFFTTQISLANTSCTDAYTSASYALSHSKKSLKAYNFEHQQYYAGRALEAMEKTRDLVGDCGCDTALDAITDSIENLDKAMDPEDWDMGRYFTKRAIADAYNVLDNLDVCSSEIPSDNSPGEALQNMPGDSNAQNGTPLSDEEQKLAKALAVKASQKLTHLKQDLQELTVLLACEDGKAMLETWPELKELSGYPFPSGCYS